jgi:hypothetical protein
VYHILQSVGRGVRKIYYLKLEDWLVMLKKVMWSGVLINLVDSDIERLLGWVVENMGFGLGGNNLECVSGENGGIGGFWCVWGD